MYVYIEKNGGNIVLFLRGGITRRLSVSFYEILVEYDADHNQYQTDIGSEYDFFAQYHCDEKQRHERRKVTQLVHQSWVAGFPHCQPEENKRNTHFEPSHVDS